MKVKISGKDLMGQLAKKGVIIQKYTSDGNQIYFNRGDVQVKDGVELDVIPESVEVPEAFDDWYKCYDPHASVEYLLRELYRIGHGAVNPDYCTHEMRDWIFNSDNYILATKAILFGYTVKKLKRWFVKVPSAEYSRYYKATEQGETVIRTYDPRYATDDGSEVFTQDEIEHYHLTDMEKVEVN